MTCSICNVAKPYTKTTKASEALSPMWSQYARVCLDCLPKFRADLKAKSDARILAKEIKTLAIKGNRFECPDCHWFSYTLTFCVRCDEARRCPIESNSRFSKCGEGYRAITVLGHDVVSR